MAIQVILDAQSRNDLAQSRSLPNAADYRVAGSRQIRSVWRELKTLQFERPGGNHVCILEVILNRHRNGETRSKSDNQSATLPHHARKTPCMGQ